jgi:hypothetical protein
LEQLKGRDNLNDIDVDERIILKCIKEIGFQGVDWIHLAQNRD